jgi:hypothetical protein
MSTRLKIKAGKRGTKKLYEEYGDQLVCVRYRYDVAQQKRYKTIELIIEEIDWCPRPAWLKESTVVGVNIELKETDLYNKIRAAGGTWNDETGDWELTYQKAMELGLKDRIVRKITKR